MPSARREALDALATISVSPKRMVIVDYLAENPQPQRRGFTEIRRRVEDVLGREITDGSLTHHLNTLARYKVLGNNPNEGWYITKLGLRISGTVKKLLEDLETESAR